MEWAEEWGSLSPKSQHISLRDYFAATALRGLMERHNVPGYSDFAAVNEAYKIADRMLKIREEGE